MAIRGDASRFLLATARGGLTVDVEWRGGKPVAATLHAALDGAHKLRAPRGVRMASATSGGARVPLAASAGGVATIKVRAGRSYRLAFA